MTLLVELIILVIAACVLGGIINIFLHHDEAKTYKEWLEIQQKTREDSISPDKEKD